MRLLVFADQQVGYQVVQYLLENYPQDLGMLLVTDLDNEIAGLARAAGVVVEAYKDEGSLQALAGQFDLGILAWWPHIIHEPLIDLPRQGFINFHPSLLPYNRGKHYNFWALVEQVPFGVTLHRVEQGIDSGDIVAQRELAYDWTDNAETLFHRARAEIAQLFFDHYPDIRAQDVSLMATSQDPGKGSFHYAREMPAASRIDLDQQYSARDLLNLLRAKTFPPHPACWFEDGDSEYEVTVQIKRKMQ